MGDSPLARFTRIKHPVARDEGLLVEHVADETVVYDNRTKEAHCLSPLAAVVFAHCDGRTTVDQLATLAAERLGEPIDPPRVMDALAQLQERDLLAVPPRDGLSRRQMIGKSAAAAGVFAGASLITTIAAPGAIAGGVGGSATCGAVTCCGCCAGGPDCNLFAKPRCCDAPGTINCQCGANDSRTVGTENPPGPLDGTSCGKYCKPGGNNYFTAQLCDCLWGQTSGAACGDIPPDRAPFRAACVTAQSWPQTQSPNSNPVAGAGCHCATCTSAATNTPPPTGVGNCPQFTTA